MKHFKILLQRRDGRKILKYKAAEFPEKGEEITINFNSEDHLIKVTEIIKGFPSTLLAYEIVST
ncbi:MAG TPA: hypothetical protein VGZ71_15660 [Puia sp.]|jgi:hypothetical protein|nr:hypothetical protein [Puia sp.]HWY36217.1 hypothetical protein [Nitrosopumilaceae archaeon]